MYALVRHAHAGRKREWPGSREERPLSARGWQQAQGVAENLAAFQPRRLLSSPYLRCQQTLAPLSSRTMLPIEDWKLLTPDADVVLLDRRLADPAMEGAVLCTHGETLKALFEFWEAHGGIHVVLNGAGRRPGDNEKGGGWLILDEPSGRTAHYVRPLHVGPVLAD